MSSSPTVIAVSGSLRGASYTKTALEYVLHAAEEEGATTAMIDLADRDIPLYDPNSEVPPAAVEAMDQVQSADSVALGTPVYHGSFSGALKNFHDFCGWDEYEDTVVGLVATAGGGSFGPTLEHLRGTVRGVHGWTLPRQVGIRNASSKFESDPNGIDGRRITDEDILDRLDRLGSDLVTYARAPMTSKPCSHGSIDD